MDMTKLAALMKNKKAALKPKEKTIKAKPGTNRYVILPGWQKGSEEIFFHEFGQHYIKDGAGQIQAVYPCADKTFGRPCKCCQGLAAAMGEAQSDAVTELLKEAKSKGNFLLNVLELDGETPNEAQVLEVGVGIFTDMVAVAEQWGETMFDKDEPQILTIERSGKGMSTRYNVQISPKKVAMPRGVLDKLRDLTEFATQESEEQETRALSAIRTVSGLLAAPAPSRDVPKTLTSTVGSAERNVEEVARVSEALDAELDDLLSDIPQ